METNSKEEDEEMHNQWWKQDVIRKLATRIVHNEQELKKHKKSETTIPKMPETKSREV